MHYERWLLQLPPHFIPRPEGMKALKEALLGAASGLLVITGAERAPGQPGMSGIGKSALAAALAWDEDVRRVFPDGILWLRLGHQPDIPLLQAELARRVGVELTTMDAVAEGKTRLRELFRGRAVLLILDDVEEIAHLELFNVLDSRGRLLFTTHDNGYLAMLADFEYQIAPWSEEDALRLLAAWGGQSPDVLPPAAAEAARECAYLPLGLAVAGAMVGATGADPALWAALVRRLRQVDADALASRFPDAPYPDLFRPLHVGVEALPEEVRPRVLDLAVFPAETPIPLSVLGGLWQVAPEEASALADDLGRRSLARWDGRHLRLHPQQQEYLRGRNDNLPAARRRLLAGCRRLLPPDAPAPGWQSLPRDEVYLWTHLPRHLVEAQERDELRRLLFNFEWLQAHLEVAGPTALMRSYAWVAMDNHLARLRDALVASLPVLAEDPSQLAGQLWGRLLACRSPEIQALLKRARQWTGRVWLRPLTSSLAMPGDPLIYRVHGRSPARAVVASADGTEILAGYEDGYLKNWDLVSGTLSRYWRGHRQRINRVAVLPGGLAVSASEDRSLKVWDWERGREVRTLTGHRYGVNGVAALADGLLVSASSDGTLRVWETATGRTVRVCGGHGGPVWDVAALPDGRRFVSGATDGTVRVWEAATGRELARLTGHESEVYAVAVTPDGRLVLSGSADRTVKAWDWERGRLMFTLRGHEGPVRALAVTADGEWCLSAAEDGLLKVWSLALGMERITLPGHHGPLYDVAATVDGYALTASEDTTISLWNLERGVGLHTLTGHREQVNALLFLPDGERVASASKDRTVKVWGLRWTRRALRVLTGHRKEVTDVAVAGGGRWLVSSSKDRTLRVWELEDGEERHVLTGHQAPVMAVAALPGGRVVSGSSDRTLRVWDVESGALVRVLTGHEEAVTAVAAAREVLVSADRGGTVRVWDGEESVVLGRHTWTVWSLAVTSDGRRVLSAGEDGRVVLWDAAQGGTGRTLHAGTAAVSAVAVTPDGRWAVFGGADRRLTLWRMSAGQAVARFTGDDALRAVAIAADGKTIAAGERSGRVHFLRVMG